MPNDDVDALTARRGPETQAPPSRQHTSRPAWEARDPDDRDNADERRDPDAFDKTDEPELLAPVRPRGHSDTVEMLEADLDALPPLPRWARAMLVRGGFNPRHPPSEMDRDGNPRSRHSARNWENPPPDLEVSSVEASFSLVRQRLRSGWSKDESEAILHRRPAVGGRRGVAAVDVRRRRLRSDVGDGRGDGGRPPDQAQEEVRLAPPATGGRSTTPSGITRASRTAGYGSSNCSPAALTPTPGSRRPSTGWWPTAGSA